MSWYPPNANKRAFNLDIGKLGLDRCPLLEHLVLQRQPKARWVLPTQQRSVTVIANIGCVVNSLVLDCLWQPTHVMTSVHIVLYIYVTGSWCVVWCWVYVSSPLSSLLSSLILFALITTWCIHTPLCYHTSMVSSADILICLLYTSDAADEL